MRREARQRAIWELITGDETVHVPLEEQEQLRKPAVVPARRRPPAAGQRLAAAAAVSSRLLSILTSVVLHSKRARDAPKLPGMEMLLRCNRCAPVARLLVTELNYLLAEWLSSTRRCRELIKNRRGGGPRRPHEGPGPGAGVGHAVCVGIVAFRSGQGLPPPPPRRQARPGSDH
jgi:hypothetical protein